MRLVRDPAWSAKASRRGRIALVVLGAGAPLSLIVMRYLPRPLAMLIAVTFSTWLGVGFLLLCFVALGDLARLGVRASRHIGAHDTLADPARRALFSRGVAASATAATAVVSGVAIRSALADVELVEVPVKLARLPRALSGLVVTQLSDIHVGPTIGRRFLEQIVERTNRERPDVIAITGDLVDGTVAHLRDQVAPLARLRARYGMYFVTGNHEYFSGADAWIAELRRLGIHVLHNERVTVGDGGGLIDVAGVDDHSAIGLGHGPDYARVARDRDPSRELLLLAHQPRQVEGAAGIGAGLHLAGHTHGGQIWPFGALVQLAQPYLAGLHRHDAATQIYVSRGTGYWGPPMRLLAPAEITKLVLVAG